MTEDEVLAEFRSSEALARRAFPALVGPPQRALPAMRARVDGPRPRRAHRRWRSRRNCRATLRKRDRKVVSPAMGGVIIGHEMGRALGVEAMFVERPEGTFELRRGFSLEPGEKVLMVEDVVTTGLSSREAIKAIEAAGGKVIAAAALVDRSAGTVDLGVPFFPLIALNFPTYAADEVPARTGGDSGDQAGQPGQA